MTISNKIINYTGHLINLLENIKGIDKFLLINDKLRTKLFLKAKHFLTTETISKHKVKITDNIVVKLRNGRCGNGIYFFKPGEKIPDKYFNNDNYFFEKYCEGTNYRVILYKNKIITIFERIIPTVVGNGKDSITVLVEKINKTRSSKNKIKLLVNNKNRIPYKGEIIKCNNLCNYSTGGTVKSVPIELINSKFKYEFIRLSKYLKLNIVSIDLIANNITSDKKNNNFYINELNFSSDWDMSYELNDKFSFLSKFLILKWIFYLFLINKIILQICVILNMKRIK